MKYTWEYNRDVDVWQNEIFNTTAECIEDAKTNYNLASGSTIAVGMAEPYEPYIDAEDILERIGESAYEECGEVAETWEPCAAEKVAINQLSDEISDAVKRWLQEQKLTPSFYKITDIREVKIP